MRARPLQRPPRTPSHIYVLARSMSSLCYVVINRCIDSNRLYDRDNCLSSLDILFALANIYGGKELQGQKAEVCADLTTLYNRLYQSSMHFSSHNPCASCMSRCDHALNNSKDAGAWKTGKRNDKTATALNSPESNTNPQETNQNCSHCVNHHSPRGTTKVSRGKKSKSHHCRENVKRSHCWTHSEFTLYEKKILKSKIQHHRSVL